MTSYAAAPLRGSLRPLGLTENDERLYLGLLRRGSAVAGELDEMVGVGEGPASHGIVRLVRLGLVAEDGSGRFHALPPRAAIDLVVASRRLELESVRQIAQELSALHQRSESLGAVEIIEAEDVPALLRRAVNGADGRLRSLGAPDLLTDLLRPTERRDVAGPQVVCDAEDLEQAVAGRSHAQLVSAEFRVVPTLPMRVHLLDHRLALIPAPAGAARALLVQDPVLVGALGFVWSATWQRAVPVDLDDPLQTRLLDGAEPDRSDREILAMMALGLKDEAAARRLGVSPRTFSRRVASIMRRLGAENRFQAGHLAASRGWLVAPNRSPPGGDDPLRGEWPPRR